jgi:protocatechuate 3,4-dioxygenase alpha subunit
MRATASQTVGPFFKDGLWMEQGTLLFDQPGGNAIQVAGRVLDADGQAVSDAVIEVWQCDPSGRFASAPEPGSGRSAGFGRAYTDGGGEYAFITLMPGTPPGGGAPYLALTLFARGLLRHLYTRAYFEGNEANAADAVLSALPVGRRASLLARPTAENGKSYVFDIRLAGAGETVFFSY